MQFHKDQECDQAMLRLMDALCTWERGTGRESTLILIPHAQDEKIVTAQNGKVLPDNLHLEPQYILAIAINKRKDDLSRIVEKVNAWQNNNAVHPLTCRKDSRHAPLRPKIKEGEVVLICSDCGYVQNHIPECVLQ